MTQDLLKSLVTLQKVADDNADKLNDEVVASNARQMTFMIVVAILSFLILLGLSTFIIKEITGSLN